MLNVLVLQEMIVQGENGRVILSNCLITSLLVFFFLLIMEPVATTTEKLLARKSHRQHLDNLLLSCTFLFLRQFKFYYMHTNLGIKSNLCMEQSKILFNIGAQ